MSRNLRFVLLALWGISVAAFVPLTLWGAVVGFRWVTTGGNYVSSSNASVSGDLVAVGSVNAGRVSSLRVGPGSVVRRGEVLASVELPTAVRTTASGTPVMAFLGSKDQEVEVASPIDGVVATVAVAAGSAVTAGQTIARLIDPQQLSVIAYVGETDVIRIRPGQAVEVDLTALDRTLPGDVIAVIPATSSATAPATANAAGGGTVTHLFPVQIRVDLADSPQLMGSSARVRIRVK